MVTGSGPFTFSYGRYGRYRSHSQRNRKIEPEVTLRHTIIPKVGRRGAILCRIGKIVIKTGGFWENTGSAEQNLVSVCKGKRGLLVGFQYLKADIYHGSRERENGKVKQRK